MALLGGALARDHRGLGEDALRRAHARAVAGREQRREHRVGDEGRDRPRVRGHLRDARGGVGQRLVGDEPARADDRRGGARRRGEGRDRGGRVVAQERGHGLPVGAREEVPEEPLARRPDEHGQPERLELAEVREQGPVRRPGLGEPEAGVEHELLSPHPRREQRLDARGELVAHVRHDVVVVLERVHDVRVAPPVHAHVRDAGAGDDLGHRRVGEAAGDVVDDPGAGLDGALGDDGARRVDADDRALGRERGDHGEHARELGLDRHAARAGARRLAAHVEDVRALAQELTPVRDRGVRLVPLAAVRERVGRDVDDAHDERATHVRELLEPGDHEAVHGTSAPG